MDTTSQNVQTTKEVNEENDGFNISKIVYIFTLYWPWFVASVVVCLVAAFVFLRFKTPVYEVSGSVLIRDNDKKGGGQMSALTDMVDFGFLPTSSNFDNEIEVLKTHTLINKVVTDLNLHVSTSLKRKFGADVPLYHSTPIIVSFPATVAEDLHGPITLDINYEKNGKFDVEATYYVGRKVKEKKTQQFTGLPATMALPVGTVAFMHNDSVPDPKENLELVAKISSPRVVTASYVASLNVQPTSKTTTIAKISVSDANTERGKDFIHRLVADYNQDANDEKNAVARRTAEFIDARITSISEELGSTDSEIAEFKKGAGISDLASDAQVARTQQSSYNQQLSAITTQVSMAEYMRDYVNNPANNNSVLPVNVGLEDKTLTTSINQYNELVLERQRLLQTATPDNPAVQQLNAQISAMHSAVKTNVESTLRGLRIAQNDLSRQAGAYEGAISRTPEQEKRLLTMSRLQEIKSSLYLMLLQKREENLITLSATANNGQLIDGPMASLVPTSPKKSLIYLIAFVIGIGLPIAIIWLREQLKYKIESVEDIKKLTDAPVIAEIPVASEKAKGMKGSIVVHQDRNDLMEEVFRNLRTNLLFTLKPGQKVVQFTSSQPAEGKSFTAGNLAVSLAFLGKKTIIIGLDIRKPGLNKVFNFSTRGEGISNHLANPSEYPLQDVIQHSDISPYLDILPGGVIPPNPTELVSRDVLDKAIDELKQTYDYVIIDSAPITIVNDADVISRVADICVYVCRADETPKAVFNYVNELKASNKFDQLCILLNGVDLSKRKNTYKYGYGYSYGKNYAYGYGYGYGFDSKKGGVKNKKENQTT